MIHFYHTILFYLLVFLMMSFKYFNYKQTANSIYPHILEMKRVLANDLIIQN